MNDRDCWTVDAMEKYGGSFVQVLGTLARQADCINLQKIKNSWPEYWAEYENIGRNLENQNGSIEL